MPLTRRTLDDLVALAKLQEKIRFVNRDELFERVRSFWENDTEPPKVFMLYGIGGIGKSRFLEELRRRSQTEQHILMVAVDFYTEEFQSAPAALFQIRLQLGQQVKTSFKNFELAYAIYFQTVTPALSLNEDASKLEAGNLLSEIVSGIGALPGVDIIAKTILALKKGKKGVKTWWQRRQAAFRTFMTLATEKKIPEMETWLAAFLAADLQECFRKNPQLRVIGCLDTYEYLWSESDRTIGRYHQPDSWVREMVKSLPQITWILSGRDALRWEQLDNKWARKIHQECLGNLSLTDSEYLLELGDVSPQWRPLIAERSHGVPFYLQLAIDIYQRALMKQEPLTKDDFQPQLDQLVRRFLRQLDKAEEEALFLLVIPRYWTRTLWNVLKTKFQPQLAAEHFDLFCHFSFVEQDEKEHYKLHPLFREIVLSLSDEQTLEHRHQFLSEYYVKLAQIESIKNIEPFQVEALHEALYHRLQAKEDEDLSKWFWGTIEPFKQAALWSIILPYAFQLVDKLQQKADRKNGGLRVSLNNLAYLLELSGRYSEAEPLYRQTLQITKQTLGLNHPDTGAAANNLANLLELTGRYSKAEPLYRRALAITEQTLGLNHPHTGMAVNNLAGALTSTGRHSEAEPLLRRALQIAEQTLSPNHPHTGIALNNLAMVLTSTGQHNEAEPLYRQAFGPDHPDTGARLNNLAELLKSTGRHSEAEPLLRRALQIAERTSGPDHPQTGTAANNLAMLLTSTGRHSEAEPLLRQALQIAEQALGPDHPTTGAALNNLASLLMSTSRYAEAEPLLRRALQIAERTFGPDHPDTGARLSYLAMLLSLTGRYAEAKRLLQRSLQITKQALGPNHPSTIAIRKHLNLLLSALKK